MDDGGARKHFGSQAVDNGGYRTCRSGSRRRPVQAAEPAADGRKLCGIRRDGCQTDPKPCFRSHRTAGRNRYGLLRSARIHRPGRASSGKAFHGDCRPQDSCAWYSIVWKLYHAGLRHSGQVGCASGKCSDLSGGHPCRHLDSARKQETGLLRTKRRLHDGDTEKKKDFYA